MGIFNFFKNNLTKLVKEGISACMEKCRWLKKDSLTISKTLSNQITYLKIKAE
jgi:hypothetical protein